MKKTLLCAALAVTVALPLAASAAPREEGQWYISPKLGYGWADSDRLSGDGMYAALGFGYVFKQNWTIEGELGYNQFDEDGASHPLEWNQLSIGASLRYLHDMGNAHPYFGIAFGYADNEVDNSAADLQDGGYFIGPIVGFEWDVTDSGALRFEVGHKYADFDEVGVSESGFWDTTVSLGFTHYFGGRAAPAPAQAPPPPPPPPPPAPPEEPVKPLPVSITLNGVNFDFDKCTLRADAIAILDEAVRVLNGNDIRVEVAGHTDSVGTEEYNQTLSECRAKVVGEYLTGNGVSGAKIATVNGYGELRPIDTNDTAEGRARNRRTELNVQ
jgi:OOP family OmpA-OmpF porin